MVVVNPGTSGWSRPNPESIIGFVVLFLLFTLAGYAIHSHIRAGRVSQRAIGIVGLCFTVAMLFGFAIGLWVLDRTGLAEPYASPPVWVVRDDPDCRIASWSEPHTGCDTSPTIHPAQTPTHPADF